MWRWCSSTSPSAIDASAAESDATASNHQRATASNIRTVSLTRCGGDAINLAARRRQQLLRDALRPARSAVWDALRPAISGEKRGFSSSTAEKRRFSVANIPGGAAPVQYGARRLRFQMERRSSIPDALAPRGSSGAARRIATAHATTSLGVIHPTHPFCRPNRRPRILAHEPK